MVEFGARPTATHRFGEEPARECLRVVAGPPGELLADGHHGPFSKLIDRTGPAVSAHLRSVAQGNEAIDFATLHEEQTE